MVAIRQRRPAFPEGGGQVLATGQPPRPAGGGVHPAAVAFYMVSILFLFRGLSGGGATASLFLVPGYTAASMQRYQNERRDLAVRNSGLDPAEEGIFDAHELKRYFDCDRVNARRPVIAEDEWRYFRALYHEYVAAEASRGRNDTYQWGTRHVPSPVAGAATPDKGRGLVASRDITAGERVFTGTNNTIVYRTGDAWRGFLLHLYRAPPLSERYADGFACDVRAWSWNQEIDVGGGRRAVAIVVDLDASSLLNRPSAGETHNIRCGAPGDGACGMDYYAVRNITEGEEILCEYSDFSHSQWETFGL